LNTSVGVRSRCASGGAGVARLLLLAAILCPAAAPALAPRFDHRDQQGPVAEFLFAKDVVWSGSAGATTAGRGAVRVGWGLDPTGDGNELFFGATLTVVDEKAAGDDRIGLTFDARYRACLGTEEFKTLLDLGIWGSVADRLAIGPLVGLGFMYDFSRDVGVLASGFLAAGAGQSRIVSFGGGVGIQYRYE
jgi:hypothetical protein